MNRLGDWDLLGVLGVGAHAVVHRAVHRNRPGRVVAVKRLRDVDPAGVTALRREAEVLADLAHPAIAVLHEVVVDGEEVALVLGLATGGSLARRLADRGGLPPDEVVDLGRRLANALAAAHDVGVLHRDVSPSNVLYGREDEPRLADFGLAAAIDVPPDEVAGTATYLDPDVAHGAPPGPASDTWGLAVVLWEALAGQPPWMGADDDAVRRAADRGLHLPLARLVPEAPADLVDVLERAVRRDPRERFRHAQELELALAGVDLVLDPVRHDAVVADPIPSDLDAEHAAAPDRPDGEPAPVPADPVPEPSAAPPPSDEPTPATMADARTTAAAGGTTVFGPRPPAPEPSEDARRWSVATIALVAAALLVPVAVAGTAWWLARADDPVPVAASPSPTPTPSAPTSSPTPSASTTASPTPSPAPLPAPSLAPTPSVAATVLPAGWVPHEPAPPCPGDSMPSPGPDEQVLRADPDGAGCTVAITVAAGSAEDAEAVVLDVPAGSGVAGRYAVAAVGDDVLVGDWDGDGVDTPAVVVRADGRVFTYDRWTADDDAEVVARATGQAPLVGDPAVATDPDGVDHVVAASDLDDG